MCSDNTEHNCSLCFYSGPAKGLEEHIYCNKRNEYRKPSGNTCSDYLYDIIKRPVRRRKPFAMSQGLDLDI